jgi:rRNA-processing protein FCF1
MEESTQLENAIKLISSKVTSLQGSVKKSKIDIGTASFVKIQEEVSKLSIKDKIQVVQAEFKADSVLASAIENHDADIILSSDSDLAALLGKKCVSIKNSVSMTVPRSKQ